MYHAVAGSLSGNMASSLSRPSPTLYRIVMYSSVWFEVAAARMLVSTPEFLATPVRGNQQGLFRLGLSTRTCGVPAETAIVFSMLTPDLTLTRGLLDLQGVISFQRVAAAALLIQARPEGYMFIQGAPIPESLPRICTAWQDRPADIVTAS